MQDTLRVRPAERRDAGDVLGLVQSNFARLDPEVNAQRITRRDERQFGGLLDRPALSGEVQRLVAIGRHGLVAYLEVGPWTNVESGKFNSVFKGLRWPAATLPEMMSQYGETNGLYTIATIDGDLVGNEAVDSLVELSGILNTGNLNIPAPDSHEELKAYAESLGTVPTARTAKGQGICVPIGENVATRPLPMTLWRGSHRMLTLASKGKD